MQSYTHRQGVLTAIKHVVVMMLFLSIVFPAILQELKFFLLVVVLCGIFIESGEKCSSIKWWFGTPILAIIFALVGLLWSLYGLAEGNLGALRVLTVMCAYPLLFVLLGGLLFPGDFKKIGTSLKWITFLLVCVQFAYLFSAVGFDGGNIYSLFQFLYGGVAVVDIRSNYILFTMPNVSSLLFLIPFLTVLLLIESKVNIFWLCVLMLALALIFLSGRRAFFVSFAVSMLFMFIMLFCIKDKLLIRVMTRSVIFIFIALLTVGVAEMAGVINIEAFINQILSSADFSTDASNLERTKQFSVLMQGFYENPFLGHGAGAVASYIRSDESPWSYELYYISLLFQYGAVGFLCYFFGVMFLLYGMVKILLSKVVSLENRKFVLAFLVGMVSFLVATSTNPYLAKFDYMWVIFVPLALINCYKVHDDI